jgi:hypothetical protein
MAKTVMKLNAGDRYRDYVIAAGETIEPGDIVGLTANGQAEVGDPTSLYAAGIAAPLDGEAKTAGETLRVQEGEAWIAVDGLTVADVGGIAFIVDNETVDGTAASAPCGPIVQFSATQGALVNIQSAANAILVVAIAGANP